MDPTSEHQSVILLATRFWGTPVGKVLADTQDGVGPAAAVLVTIVGETVDSGRVL